MSDEPVRRQVTLANPNGLHLSPISALVKEAMNHEAELLICFDGNIANARSTMELMLLGATCGAVLSVEASGNGAEAAADAAVRLLSEP